MTIKKVSIGRLFSNLPIFRKGLLLTLLPVTFQLFSVVLFIYMQNRIVESRKWQFHSIDVIAEIDELRAAVNAAYYNSLLSIFLADSKVQREETEYFTVVDVVLQRLPGIVADNKQQVSHLREIQESYTKFYAVMKKLDEPSGLAPGTERADLYRRIFSESVAAKSDFDKKLDSFRAEEQRLNQIRRERVDEALARTSRSVMGGYLFLVCFSGLVYYFFQESISRRVDVLIENLDRVAKGEIISSSLEGEDEIAQLDLAIHTLSTALSEKALETEMFLYSVSHDLRSPLVNLSGFTDELNFSAREVRNELGESGEEPRNLERARKILDSDFEKSFTFIRSAVSRLSRIIDGLLRLSRAGRVRYKNESVELGPLVRRVLDSLAITISKHQVEINVQELPTVFGDPDGLEQIFSNLIANAVAYLDPARPGVIDVGTETQTQDADGLVRVYVRDNGRGISTAAQKKLFLVFHRFHPDVQGGEGVGLALVRRVVVTLGGKISCESEEGKGTTFTVALPQAARRLEIHSPPIEIFPSKT